MSDAAHSAAQPDLPSPYEEGGKRRGRARTSHTVAKVLLTSVVVLAMVTGLSISYFYRHLNGNLNVVDVTDQLENRPDKVKVEGPKEPLNILVMGSDTRDGEGNNIDGLTGGGERSDTTILFHLTADRKAAYGISIPRDSLVNRPECKTEDGDPIYGGTQVMWNEAFAVGGAACTIQQFEQVTGVRVDNYVKVDFRGFRGMVDAIDGVEVCIPEDIEDPAHGIRIAAGTREIRGEEALNYVRARYTLGDGSDIGRIQRQQAFVAAMAAKVISGGTLARPDRLVRFLNAATQSLTTDLENVWKIAKVGVQFKKIGLNKIQFITVPWVYSTAQPGRVEWKPEAADLWEKIAQDKPLGKLREGAITAGDDVEGGPSPSASGSDDTPGQGASPSPSDSASADAEAEAEAEAREAAGLCS